MILRANNRQKFPVSYSYVKPSTAYFHPVSAKCGLKIPEKTKRKTKNVTLKTPDSFCLIASQLFKLKLLQRKCYLLSPESNVTLQTCQFLIRYHNVTCSEGQWQGLLV